MRASIIMLPLAFTALLAGCDVSRVTDLVNPREATFDLNAVMTSLYTLDRSFTATAKHGAESYQLFFRSTPIADGDMDGVVKKRASQTLTIRSNGNTVLAANFTSYFTSEPFQLVGARYGSGEVIITTTPHEPLPTSATIGSSGSLGTQTVYNNSRRTRVLARQQTTWTLEPVIQGLANFCTHSTISNLSNVIVSTTTTCARINPDGEITSLNFKLPILGTSLSFE